jgi:hypothetical protein
VVVAALDFAYGRFRRKLALSGVRPRPAEGLLERLSARFTGRVLELRRGAGVSRERPRGWLSAVGVSICLDPTRLAAGRVKLRRLDARFCELGRDRRFVSERTLDGREFRLSAAQTVGESLQPVDAGGLLGGDGGVNMCLFAGAREGDVGAFLGRVLGDEQMGRVGRRPCAGKGWWT